jgi:hypothetical protein
LPTDAQTDFVNALGTGGIVALISAGGGIITACIKAVGDKSNYKSQIELAKIENETSKVELDQKKIDDMMSPQEKALAEEIIKSQDGSFDAVKAITDNPNLTAEEKMAALEDLKDDVDGGLSTTTKIMIGVGALAAIGLVIYLYKQSNKN